MTPNLKIQRRFKPVENEQGKYDLVRRDQKVKAVELVALGRCTVCNNLLYVAPGQRIRFHKECRKEGRKRFGRSENVVEVDKDGNPLTTTTS